MFTSQIKLRGDTSTDEGNVSLRTKPAFNEIVARHHHLTEVTIQHPSYIPKFGKSHLLSNSQLKCTPHLKAPVIRSGSLEGVVGTTSRNLTMYERSSLPDQIDVAKMLTSQITLREGTFADEGNVSLRTKPAFNEIANSDANETGPQTVTFQLDRAIATNTNTKMHFG
ncbi:hypothetical protein CEXT_405151 [Caerostris extrusa]|uniref:Uncharacterized protein n=1 Tax=Caerostris extrusa TaxID=172846 RepID=A0AAV4MGE1_CAEEX|nr:hypothetical protein CEXT_405151 [Caerostris extrusa]